MQSANGRVLPAYLIDRRVEVLPTDDTVTPTDTVLPTDGLDGG